MTFKKPAIICLTFITSVFLLFCCNTNETPSSNKTIKSVDKAETKAQADTLFAKEIEVKNIIYVLENEKVNYSFESKNGKIMTLCSDKERKYLVYRFGTKNNIELEYPTIKDKTSWKKFEYSYYLRGGGIQNEGMDLNYVSFTIDNIKYVIYDTYFAHGEITEIGIQVINLKNKKTVKIIGDKSSQKGTLVDFRFDHSLQESDELYD